MSPLKSTHRKRNTGRLRDSATVLSEEFPPSVFDEEASTNGYHARDDQGAQAADQDPLTLATDRFLEEVAKRMESRSIYEDPRGTLRLIRDYRSVLQEHAREEGDEPTDEFGMVWRTAYDTLTADFPPPHFLAWPMIPENRFSLLVGKWKVSGKTLLLLTAIRKMVSEGDHMLYRASPTRPSAGYG